MLSTFWQVWIAVIVLGSMIGCGVLIMYTSRGQRKEETDQTTGHDYDGIQELDNPLPRWWVFMFWGTIVFGFGYLSAYGLGNYDGWLTVTVDDQEVTWTSTNQWKAEVQAFDKEIAPLYAEYRATDIAELAKNEDALQTGQRLFKSNCSVCHGTAAKGAQGFPNLTDNDWLYGGSPDKIRETLLLGRVAAMPPWGDALGEQGVKEMTAYVLSLSGRTVNQKDADAGKAKFAMCAACHGADGKGSVAHNLPFGAPNLTDNIWLYGGSQRAVEETLNHGRAGVMPAWKEILGEDKIHLLTAYVYSLSQDK